MKGYARFGRYVTAWLRGVITWREMIAEWKWQRMLRKVKR